MEAFLTYAYDCRQSVEMSNAEEHNANDGSEHVRRPASACRSLSFRVSGSLSSRVSGSLSSQVSGACLSGCRQPVFCGSSVGRVAPSLGQTVVAPRSSVGHICVGDRRQLSLRVIPRVYGAPRRTNRFSRLPGSECSTHWSSRRARRSYVTLLTSSGERANIGDRKIIALTCAAVVDRRRRR